MRVDIWSDVVCPWCYIGKRRFERARAAFAYPLEVVWRSYELNPNAPAVRDGGSYERIARKYNITVEQAKAQYERITELAALEGLDYHLDRVRAGRSFDAHRLLHLARVRGIQDAVKERFLAAYLQEGVAIGLPEELAPLAVSAGLDVDRRGACARRRCVRRRGARRRGPGDGHRCHRRPVLPDRRAPADPRCAGSRHLPRRAGPRVATPGCTGLIVSSRSRSPSRDRPPCLACTTALRWLVRRGVEQSGSSSGS